MPTGKKILPILFGTLLLDMVGVGMVFPIIPVLFTDPSSHQFLLQGYSQAGQFFIAGLVAALFGLMTFIAAPILGELSDVYGRKKLLTIGIGVLAVSQFLFGFGIEIRSLTLLLISRIIAGLAAANFSIAQATIADVTEPKDRAKNFGIIGGAFGLGFIIGPLLGGWLASAFQNAAAPFWFAALLGTLNLIFVSLFFTETRRANAEARKRFNIFKGIHNIRAAFRDKDARPLYLTSFLYISGFQFFIAFVGVLLVTKYAFSEASVGTFFGVVGIWIFVTQMVILRFIASRYGERKILRYSMVCISLALAAFPFMPNPFFLYVVVPLIAIPQGLTMANLLSLISKSVSADKQGAALGINGSLIALAQGSVPLLAGIGSGAIGIYAPFLAGAVFVISAWSVLFSPYRKK